MIFAKLDVCFWRHPRFLEAGLAAAGYWAACLGWLRENDSVDGFVPRKMIGFIANTGVRRAQKLAKKLVDAGLFEAQNDGYLLLRYAEKNETGDETEARRTAWRTRQAQWRRTKKGVLHHDVAKDGSPIDAAQGTPPGATESVPAGPPNVTRDVTGDSHGDVKPTEIRDQRSEIRSQRSDLGDSPQTPLTPSGVRNGNAADDGCFGMAVAAWAEGISSETGQPCLPPRGRSAELIRLLDAFSAFCQEPDRVAWARRSGAEYARARTGEKLSGFGFADWLNSGKPDRASGTYRVSTPERPVAPNGRLLQPPSDCWKVGK